MSWSMLIVGRAIPMVTACHGSIVSFDVQTMYPNMRHIPPPTSAMAQKVYCLLCFRAMLPNKHVFQQKSIRKLTRTVIGVAKDF